MTGWMDELRGVNFRVKGTMLYICIGIESGLDVLQDILLNIPRIFILRLEGQLSS